MHLKYIQKMINLSQKSYFLLDQVSHEVPANRNIQHSVRHCYNQQTWALYMAETNFCAYVSSELHSCIYESFLYVWIFYAYKNYHSQVM